MVQKTLELTEEQAEQLERLARLGDRTVEEMLCDAVERLMRVPVTWAHPTEEQRRRAMAVPSFDSDVSDLGENHDKYLAEAFAQ